VIQLVLRPHDADCQAASYAVLSDVDGCQTVASVVILGSDPDSADHRWHRQRRISESGSGPNITAIRCRQYKTSSCQRLLNKGYNVISYIKPYTILAASQNSHFQP
jgi:hypothetical protein